MQRVLVSFLLAAMLYMATTFAGMVLFGMGGQMAGMSAETCLLGQCASAAHAMDAAGGLGCVSHCLSSAVPALAMPTPFVLSFVLFVAAAALFLFSSEFSKQVAPFFHRWPEGIGKLLLRQKLCTVIVRN